MRKSKSLAELLDEYPLPTPHPSRHARDLARQAGKRLYWSNHPCELHNSEVSGCPITLRYTSTSGCYFCLKLKSKRRNLAQTLSRQQRKRLLIQQLRPGMPVLPTSQAEAKKQGSPRYFSGRACERGHFAERYTSNRVCVECAPVALRLDRVIKIKGENGETFETPHTLVIPPDHKLYLQALEDLAKQGCKASNT